MRVYPVNISCCRFLPTRLPDLLFLRFGCDFDFLLYFTPNKSPIDSLPLRLIDVRIFSPCATSVSTLFPVLVPTDNKRQAPFLIKGTANGIALEQPLLEYHLIHAHAEGYFLNKLARHHHPTLFGCCNNGHNHREECSMNYTELS